MSDYAPIDPTVLLNPLHRELILAYATLEAALAQERALHAAEVRGLTGRVEGLEAQLRVARTDLDRLRTGG